MPLNAPSPLATSKLMKRLRRPTRESILFYTALAALITDCSDSSASQAPVSARLVRPELSEFQRDDREDASPLGLIPEDHV